MPRRYRVVDVFAERRYAGNPLSVVLDAEGLSTEAMQAIARETNHSETTFVLSERERDGAWPVRIFTPARELPFAGHPTLGTAAVLLDALGAKAPLALDLPVGRIPVDREGDLLWMRQPEPRFGATVPADVAAALVGLAPEDMDTRAPAQTVSTGVPFLIVPVARLEAARRARLDLARLRAAGVGAEAVLLVCPETESKDARWHARSFTEAFGIPEDPATGGAAGPFAAWLLHHRLHGEGPVDLAIEQGIEVGRPSKLHLRARRTDKIEVRVGGRVVPVAEGVLLE